MNNPLPRWWMWLFVLTIVFSVGLPGALPGPGQLRGQRCGWTSAAEYDAEQASGRRSELAPLYAQLRRA